MKERPILFSAPMVRALLEGRKQQTRRIVKPQPISQGIRSFGEAWKYENGSISFSGLTSAQLANPSYGFVKTVRCPYGQPGDQLFVRETWMAFDVDRIHYRADYQEDKAGDREHGLVWKPSIYMPRWASRISLRMTDVRVQRLQDIDGIDCLAEGVPEQGGNSSDGEWRLRMAYKIFWNSINGEGAWDLNPWVWCLSFEVLK